MRDSGASQVVLVVKNPPANAGDASSVPRWGKSGGRHGNPLQYSCLENPMDREAWRATVHRVAELDMTEATQHACIRFCRGYNQMWIKTHIFHKTCQLMTRQLIFSIGREKMIYSFLLIIT